MKLTCIIWKEKDKTSKLTLSRVCRCSVKSIGLWNVEQFVMDRSKWQEWTVNRVQITLSPLLTCDRWDTNTSIITFCTSKLLLLGSVCSDSKSNRSQTERSLLLDSTKVFLFQRHCPTDRIITHYYYPSWPDRGVPKDPSSLCIFAEHIRQDLEASPRLGPAVVHCRSDPREHIGHLLWMSSTSDSFTLILSNF